MKAFFKYAMATVVGLFIFVAIYAFILVMAIIGVASMSASSSVEKTEAHSVYCIDMNGTVSGFNGFGQAQAFDVTIPLTIDGITLTKVVSRIQWNQNKVTVRNAGAV